MENKGVLLVETKLKPMKMIKLLLMLKMMELMKTKLDREIKAIMFLVKLMVLVQALELWMMVNRIDSLAYDQMNHHEFCVARFQNLDEQTEVVQN